MISPNKVLLLVLTAAFVLSSCRSHTTVQSINDSLLIKRLESLKIWQADQIELFDTITYTYLPGSSLDSADSPRATRVIRHSLISHQTNTEANEKTSYNAVQHRQQTKQTVRSPNAISTRQFILVFSLYGFMLMLVLMCFKKFG